MKRIVLVVLLGVTLMPAARADELAAVRTLAEQGDTRAQFVLGTMYRDGRGVAQNAEEMLRWWRLAAEAGNFDAQFALGNVYSSGYRVAQDHVMAYMWFDILATQAKEEFIGKIAGSNRNAVKSFMTPAEVARAQALSADWLSRHAR